MTIKAIETRYAGCRFRSRLEARWAVFFDTLGIEWEYEPQGFEVGFDGENLDCSHKGTSRTRYLPDFWLPATQTWVEVKGDERSLDKDALKLIEAMDWGRGLPHVEESCGSTRGLLLLGSVPDGSRERVVHSILQHHKGVIRNLWSFEEPPLYGNVYYTGDFAGDSSCGDTWVSDSSLQGTMLTPRLAAREWDMASDRPGVRVIRAYIAARSARFEFGERGR